jgi:putative ABC transport system ATP-binding protein
MSALLRVIDLRKDDILKGISFEMQAGQMIAVMGPSGSGKSTLLYNVSGMDQADSGEVWLYDTQIVNLDEDDKADIRLNRMGFVFQQMNMLSNLNIIDNIAFPAVCADRKNKREHYIRAQKLLDEFHIGDLAQRSIKEVSGGQLQRACICRSLIMDPQIIFADEPTGALNRSSSDEVMNELLSLNRDGTTIMCVTHDPKVAAKCSRIFYIVDGGIMGEKEMGHYDGGEKELRDRERELNNWLMEQGW